MGHASRNFASDIPSDISDIAGQGFAQSSRPIQTSQSSFQHPGRRIFPILAKRACNLATMIHQLWQLPAQLECERPSEGSSRSADVVGFNAFEWAAKRVAR
jgi:hypothetical protein